MKIDYNSLIGSNSLDTEIDPIKIFGLLPKSTSNGLEYAYLRAHQDKVLEIWFQQKDKENNIIQMNTGSGKTLVGLLILKSCMNELKEPTVYVVPDKLLKSQVIETCKDIGINYTEEHTNIEFLNGKSILICTVDKVFNGRSVFGLNSSPGEYVNISSLLIDDAHACVERIRSKFCIKVDKNNNENLYEEIFRLSSYDLQKQNPSAYFDLEKSDFNTAVQIPFWVWYQNNDKILKMLYNRIQEANCDEELKFSYALLKDNFQFSRCSISGTLAEISTFLPLPNIIKGYDKVKRKILMSATLNDLSGLVTTLNLPGEAIEKSIMPHNANDIGERLILSPKSINAFISDDEIRKFVSNYSDQYSVVVLTPSIKKSREWERFGGKIVDSENIGSEIEKLKTIKKGLTVISNRYNGINLPNDACRILVLDDIPSYEMLSDKVSSLILADSEKERIRIVQLIEQGMGRGIRSAADYCVVILMGARLINYVYSNKAKEYYSAPTKKQIELSEAIIGTLKSETFNLSELGGVIDDCLKRDTNWINASKAALSGIDYSPGKYNDKAEISIREAFNHLLRMENDLFLKKMNSVINEATDSKVKGYLYQKFAELINGIDQEEAQKLLLSGYKYNGLILKPIKGIVVQKLEATVVNQAENIQKFISEFVSNINELIIHIDAKFAGLEFRTDSFENFENGIFFLGKLLGFRSQRPEKEFGEGPDVIWLVSPSEMFIFECKNEVTSSTLMINKKDCNQINGSINWHRNRYGDLQKGIPFLIHPYNVFEKAASPDQRIRIINSRNLDKLKEAARSLFAAMNHDRDKQTISIAERLKSLNLTKETFSENFSIPYKKTSSNH